MTTQTLFSENKMSTKYFLGELKRSWPKMVLYFIVFCLTMVIPLLMNNMGMLSYNLDMTREENLLRNSSRLLNMITEYVQIWVPMSMIVAVFAGCYVTKILNNKVSADYFHSVPMRRESIFVTRLSAGFITYFVTFLANVIIVLILCETQTLADGYGWLLFKAILKNLGFSLLGFFMIFSTTVFAGMLCGTTIMQLLMTLYLNLIVFVYYSSIFITFEQFFDYFNSTYYFENDTIVKLVPFVRLMSLDLIDNLSIPDICFFAIGSLLLLMGAVALYRFRRIEKAGTPVVFDGFAAFFRYSVIIPVTLLGGIFFDLLVGSFVWYVIGLIIAAFLSFLLLNTILEKNARKMFTGIKSFGIYCAVMLVVFLALGFDVFGIDTYIPDKDSVRSVNITLGNQIQNIDFDDRDVIKAAVELDKSHKKLFKTDDSAKEGHGAITIITEDAEMLNVAGVNASAVEDEQIFYTGYLSKVYFRVVYKLKSGIHWARNVAVYYNSDEITNLAKAVADSDDYENYWRDCLDAQREEDNTYYDYYLDGDSISEDNGKFDDIVSGTMLNDISDNLPEIDYNYFQRTQIGYLNIYGWRYNNYKNLSMPIYVGDYADKRIMNHRTESEYFDYIASNIVSIYIYRGTADDYGAADAIKLPYDLDLYKEVLMNLTNLCGSKNIFTEAEPGYHVSITYKSSHYAGLRNFSSRFLKDRVPGSVENIVG